MTVSKAAVALSFGPMNVNKENELTDTSRARELPDIDSMFDELDRRLEGWAKAIVADLTVSFNVPTAETDKLNLCLYLLDVIPVAAGRGVRLPPLQMTLRYLVVAQGPIQSEVHQLLGTVLIAALENAEFEIEKEPLPFDVWKAFGIAPRPSFVLRVPFKYERAEKVAQPVLQPLTVKQTVLETLQGRISINRIPIMNANVEIPALKLSARTDADGNFQFPALPSEPSEKDLRIRIKGREFSVSTGHAERRGSMFLFDLKLEE